MKKLSSRGQKWLKAFHVFFSSAWVGAAVCLTMMFLFMDATDGGELYGMNTAEKFIDDFIIIPGAMGCLLTGVIYSIFTNWGWFKHRWITIKWIINLFGVIFGTFWLGPWTNSLPPIAKAEGLMALDNVVYATNLENLSIFGTIQGATLVFALFISILKPWKKRRPSTETV